MNIKVTVCQLNDDPELFEADWKQLVAHVRECASDLVLLPEMCFAPWFALSKNFHAETWQYVVECHDAWMERIADLSPATVIGSRPVNQDGRRLNRGFFWSVKRGCCAVHDKYYLPDEEGYWEASWYGRGDGIFSSFENEGVRLGILICTEIWFMERARAYGKQGVHIIASPRATGRATVDKWLVGGRANAVVSGAYSLCSNRVSDTEFGGQGWVIDPDGEVLGLTSPENPYLSVTIDTDLADKAKKTYPRYVKG